MIDWAEMFKIATELEIDVACMLDEEPEVWEIEQLQEKIGRLYDLIKEGSGL